jgi:hypothetical protein
VTRGSSITWIVVGGVVALLVVAGVDAFLSSESGTSTPTTESGTSTPTTTDIQTSPSLSAEQEIERTGNRWARFFGAGRLGCQDMTQPACERAACERPGGRLIQNCTPLSLEFRSSFAEAVVEDIAIRGHRAAARFSNGETILFVEVGASGSWWIHKVGGNAGRKFFAIESS